MIVTAGTIGVGKSTFTKIISDELGTKPFYEPVGDNPVLPLYYQDPKKYGFLLQIYFLNKRFNLIKEAYKENNNVLDRSIYEDYLFTQINYENGNMAKQEFGVYEDLLSNMMEEIDGLPKKSPDLLVYLYADFDIILDRVKLRGREYEQIDENPGLKDYYQTLWSKYHQWYEDYDKSDKIRIDVGKHDLNTEEGKQYVINKVKESLKQKNLL